MNDFTGAYRSAWAVIILACVLACIPVIGFGAWLVAGPLLTVAFILAIVVLAKGGTGKGIELLLATLILGPVVVVVAPIVSTLVFGTTAAGAAAVPAVFANLLPKPPVASPASRPAVARAPASLPDADKPESAPARPPAPKIAPIAAAGAIDRAAQKYPALKVAGSPLNAAFIERMENAKRGRPKIFDDPEWPTVLAAEAVASLPRDQAQSRDWMFTDKSALDRKDRKTRR